MSQSKVKSSEKKVSNSAAAAKSKAKPAAKRTAAVKPSAKPKVAKSTVSVANKATAVKAKTKGVTKKTTTVTPTGPAKPAKAKIVTSAYVPKKPDNLSTGHFEKGQKVAKTLSIMGITTVSFGYTVTKVKDNLATVINDDEEITAGSPFHAQSGTSMENSIPGASNKLLNLDEAAYLVENGELTLDDGESVPAEASAERFAAYLKNLREARGVAPRSPTSRKKSGGRSSSRHDSGDDLVDESCPSCGSRDGEGEEGWKYCDYCSLTYMPGNKNF